MWSHLPPVELCRSALPSNFYCLFSLSLFALREPGHQDGCTQWQNSQLPWLKTIGKTLDSPNIRGSDSEVTSARGRPVLTWTLQTWRAAGQQVTMAQEGLDGQAVSGSLSH